ncbi:MAG: hypothetical protein K6F53_02350 [Lachnospiraceae bacterium]|nr:hypothetical protein [Lachnospiraceae bacterium]
MERKTLFERIHGLLSMKVVPIIAALLCAGGVFFCYYERHVLKAPFRTVYRISLVYLVLSLITFLFGSMNRKSELKPLIVETLPGYFFFAAFVLITMVLRG